MKSTIRSLIFVALVIGSLFAAWRIVAHAVADSVAITDPERALDWVPGHPGALLEMAERQLAAGGNVAAAETARHLLRAAPLEGRAFRVLGEVAMRADDVEGASVLYKQAARLSPRDVPTHTWLVRRDVTAGNYVAALAQMDRLMTVSPPHRAAVLPLMAELSQLPAFVDALIPMLATNPAWRGRFLKELQNGRHPEGAERVALALDEVGGLDADERLRRVESLIAQKAWGRAYAYWVSDLPDHTRLPQVYNGDFAEVPSDRGFDWRLRRVPGVQLRFVDDPAKTGLMAHVSFRRRPVPHAGLEQLLLLAPGKHHLTVRMRAEGLQSQRGLQWVVQCAPGPVVGRSEGVDGSFSWREFTIELEVPSDCPAQWLRLRNRVSKGSGQFTSGDLWIDDVSITPAVQY